MALAAGRTMVPQHRWPSRACWCNDESVVGRDDESATDAAPTLPDRATAAAAGQRTVLARWHVDEPATGRRTLLAHWRNAGVGGGADDGARSLAQRRVGGGADDGARSLARRRVGDGAENGARSRGRDNCVPAGRTPVPRHWQPSLARGCDGESVVGLTAVLACWRNNKSAAGWTDAAPTCVLAQRRWQQGRWRCSVAGPTMSRRRGRGYLSPLARRAGGGADDGVCSLLRQRVCGGADSGLACW
jgi:hypothetical protein